jgi:hypothetical protein
MTQTPSNAFRVEIVAAGLPTWRQGQSVNAWREISGSSLSLLPFMDTPRGSGPHSGKVDAWNGLAADTRTNDLLSVGNGGHDDYWGNEVDRLRLNDNAPAWTRLVVPTIPANVTSDQDYYADGKPASQHTYHDSIMIESLNKALRFPGGSRSTVGNPSPTITAFNVGSVAWESSATWSGLSAPVSVSGGGQAYAKHPTTENVYGQFYNTGLYRWNKGTPGSWTLVRAGGFAAGAASRSTAAACDPTRGAAGQIFFLGGGDPLGGACAVYDIGANTLSTITLSGSDIRPFYGIGMVYVSATDRYYACVPSAGGSSVYVITPTSGTTWACSLLSTTGGASLPDTSNATNTAYAPFTKFQYFPSLGGVAFLPRFTSNCWFLRLH